MEEVEEHGRSKKFRDKSAGKAGSFYFEERDNFDGEGSVN